MTLCRGKWFHVCELSEALEYAKAKKRQLWNVVDLERDCKVVAFYVGEQPPWWITEKKRYRATRRAKRATA